MTLHFRFIPALANLSSVSSLNGKQLTAVEQVLVRMKQEAFLDLSKTVELRHLIAALVFVPNGPARFKMSELFRTARVGDLNLRKTLGLGEFDPGIRIEEDCPLSEPVGLILLNANSTNSISGVLNIRNTTVLYDSLIEYFSEHRGNERGEHELVQSVLNGTLRRAD